MSRTKRTLSWKSAKKYIHTKKGSVKDVNLGQMKQLRKQQQLGRRSIFLMMFLYIFGGLL